MKEPLLDRSPAERERILEAIRQALEARADVLFAYVYGSFVEDRPFHDVDIGVYLTGVSEQETPWLAQDVAAELSKVIHLLVDVRLLNDAPLHFRYHVFRGHLLLSKDDNLLAQSIEQTARSYLDLKPLWRQALKEAMTS